MLTVLVRIRKYETTFLVKEEEEEKVEEGPGFTQLALLKGDSASRDVTLPSWTSLKC